MVLLEASRGSERRANRGRHLGRRLVGEHRRQRVGGALADRADIEAADRGWQQADVGQHRKAAADAGVVIHHPDLVRRKQIAQAIFLAGLGRLGDAEEMIVRIELGHLHGVERGNRLHQRLAGAAGL